VSAVDFTDRSSAPAGNYKGGKNTHLFFRFFRINTCQHVFDHWATIPSGIPNVCNFEDLHKSRVNRLARRGNIARVSDELGQRADLCRTDSPHFFIRRGLFPLYDKTSEAMKFISIYQCYFFCFFCYLLICDWSRGQNRPLDQSHFSKHQNKFIERLK
jgi:hypothetical protein